MHVHVIHCWHNGLQYSLQSPPNLVNWDLPLEIRIMAVIILDHLAAALAP